MNREKPRQIRSLAMTSAEGEKGVLYPSKYLSIDESSQFIFLHQENPSCANCASYIIQVSIFCSFLVGYETHL